MESVTQESDNSNQIENTNEIQNGTVKGNSDVLVGETYFDYFEGLGIENIDDYYNNVLFPSVNSDFPQIMPFASWPGGTGDFWTTNGYTPTNILAMKIGPGFTSWETNGWTTEAIWKDTVLRALKNSFTATNTRINETNSVISALKAMDTHLSGEINKLNDWNTIGRGRVDNLWSWSTNVNNKNKEQDTNILNLQTWRNEQIDWNAGQTKNNTIFTNNISTLWDWHTLGRARVENLWSWKDLVNDTNRDQSAKLDNLWSWKDLVNDTNRDQSAKLDNLWSWKDLVNDTNRDQSARLDNLWSWKDSVNDTNRDQSARLDNLWSWKDSVNDTNRDQSARLDNLWLWSDNVNKKNDTQDDRLKKIESFDFGSIIDLTVLVTAINAVGTKVQKLIDLFNVTKVEPGTFTFFLQGSIKTQTDAIVQALSMVDESLNNSFINYFDDSINGKFWKAFKKFDDLQMAVFFEVFFENYRLELDKTWVNTLEVWNTTNGYLDSSYNALVIITQWLKQIYEKPGTPAIVNVPPFDYERLEKMLKKLEFGEITNEAGTNIWDFLKSLIDNLGEIITTQIEEFVNVLSEILDFLDKLIDKLIGLIVPKNLDFMRTGFDDISLKFNLKFDSFLSIATDVTNMFKPIPKSVVDELSFDLMGVPFVPKLSLLDSFVPKFRNVMALMLWFQTGWWAFRRFTGTGDVVNDN